MTDQSSAVAAAVTPPTPPQTLTQKVKSDLKADAKKVETAIETELAKGEAATLAEAHALLADAHELINRLVADGHSGLAGFVGRLKAYLAKV